MSDQVSHIPRGMYIAATQELDAGRRIGVEEGEYGGKRVWPAFLALGKVVYFDISLSPTFLVDKIPFCMSNTVYYGLDLQRTPVMIRKRALALFHYHTVATLSDGDSDQKPTVVWMGKEPNTLPL